MSPPFLLSSSNSNISSYLHSFAWYEKPKYQRIQLKVYKAYAVFGKYSFKTPSDSFFPAIYSIIKIEFIYLASNPIISV